MGIDRPTDDQCTARRDRAAMIIADYEAQHEFKLPEPWKATVEKLLFNGLTDAELHQIFDTLVQVEVEAGRLERKTREVDYAAFKD